MTIGIIGVGHIAGYLVEGLSRAGDRPAIVLSPRNRERVRTLAERFGAKVAADNGAVVEAAEIVILSTRPDQAVEAARGLPWRDGQTVISVASGVTLAALAPVTGPARVVRAMPISCAAIGESPTSLFPGDAAARELFEGLGSVHVMADEATFAAASTLGAFYGWVYAMIAEVAAWTEDGGVPPDVARQVVAETVRGATGMVLEHPDEGLPAMLEALCTPGGITRHGLDALEDREAVAAWSAACAAAFERIRELEKTTAA